MTLMPASRKARAITFAPRSCPSRPGLPPRTRIFFSLVLARSDMATAYQTKTLYSGTNSLFKIVAWSGLVKVVFLQPDYSVVVIGKLLVLSKHRSIVVGSHGNDDIAVAVSANEQCHVRVRISGPQFHPDQFFSHASLNLEFN